MASCFTSEAADESDSRPPKSIKILAIGNSFSEDGLRWVYQIAKDAGIKDVTLANLMIGGCTLKTHWLCAQTNAAKYVYQKNINGNWTYQPNSTMEYGIQDEKWDIISIQQVSQFSGIPETYNSDLDNLVAYVNEKKTNPEARLVWQMTWAYQADSNHGGFGNYGRDQGAMYRAITETVSEEIAGDKNFSVIIPSGTAVQNMRTSYIGDHMTRDGFHMSLNLGRYVVGMTWVKALTGISIDDVTWVPDGKDVPDTLLPVIKEAVNNAVKTPFAVTPSSYQTAPNE